MSIKNRRKKLRYGENPNQNAYINEYNKLSIFDCMRYKTKLQYLYDFKHPLIYKFKIRKSSYQELLDIIIPLKNHCYFFDLN